MSRQPARQIQLPFVFGEAPKRLPRRSLVIEAGAGTGKTTSIVSELLNILIEEPELSADRLVLVTFTEKAAGEIADRIRQAVADLHATRDSPQPRWPATGQAIFTVPAEAAEQARTAIGRHFEQLDRFHSQTIHSFCQRILRLHPIEAGLHPQFTVIEGHERTRIYDQIYGEWLHAETVQSRDQSSIDDWDVALAHFGQLDRIRETIFSFLPKRDLLLDERYTLGDISEAEPELLRVLGSIRSAPAKQVEAIGDDAVRATLDYLRNHQPPEGESAEKWLAWFAPIGEALAKVNLTRAGAFRVELKFLRGEKFITIVDRLESHRAAVVIRRLASRFITWLEGEKLRRAIVDFDDLLLRTASLLRNEQVLEQVRGRFDYIFVDEFQDTDRVQAEIVDRLSRDSSGRLVPGRTVIVGDPKQSIYSFRRADPETYERTVESFIAEGAERRTLTDQYRSDAPLVGALNAMFSELFSVPSTTSVARPGYEALTARRPEPIHQLDARITFLRSAEPAQAETDERQALAIAEWITARVAEGSRYRRFAVLLRKLTNVDRYLETFERYGIPCVTPPTRAFLEKPAAVDLISALRAIAWPFDTGALIAAARSPYFALTDTEIARRFLGSGGSDPAFSDFEERIRAYASAARHLTVLELMERLVADSGVESVYRLAAGGERSLLWLDAMRDIAAEFDLRSGGSVAQFVQEIARRREESEEAEPSWIDEQQDAVALMTVHAAKGLEFETVILPDLSSGLKQDTVRLFAVDEPPTLLMSGRLAALGGDFRTADDVPLAKIGTARMEAETDRLFYVAVTRAKSDVVFVTDAADRTQNFWVCLNRIFAFDPKSVDARFPQEPGRVVVDLPVVLDPIPAAFERVSPALDRIAERVRFSADVAPLLAREPEVDDAPPIELPQFSAADSARTRAASANRAAGIALHRLLELWDGRKESIDSLVSAVSAEQRLDADARRKVRARILAAARSKALPDGETVGRELPVYYRNPDGVLVEGRIDRLMHDGTKHIVVDYKSGRPDPARLAGDQDQVERYCAAIRAATGGECTGLLWYIDAERDEIVVVGE
jgi:ATP-dependent helicase/nuclease subunit A